MVTKSVCRLTVCWEGVEEKEALLRYDTLIQVQLYTRSKERMTDIRVLIKKYTRSQTHAQINSHITNLRAQTSIIASAALKIVLTPVSRQILKIHLNATACKIYCKTL